MRDLLKSVGKHAIIYGIGDLLGKSIGFLLIPVYTAYLRPEEYGTLDLLDLTGYLVGLFVAMGMTAAVFRFYHASDDEAHRDEVVSSAWLATACASW